MTIILDVITAVTQIRSAVTSMKREETRREFDYPNEHFARIGHALSDIHFADEGILEVMRKIVNKQVISEEDHSRLVEFNQREEPIRNALGNLMLDHGRKARNSIKQSATLRMIARNKISLRNAIQTALNEAITFDEEVKVAEVTRLLSEIEALNRDIQEAEHTLRRYI